MPDGKGFLFAFSGQRANKKEEAFYETKRLMQEQYPHLPIIFMDDVVSKKQLPIHWCPAHRALHPTTRLLTAFAEFNEIGVCWIKFETISSKIQMIKNTNADEAGRNNLSGVLDSPCLG